LTGVGRIFDPDAESILDGILEDAFTEGIRILVDIDGPQDPSVPLGTKR
jgi:hypothetical protein